MAQTSFQRVFAALEHKEPDRIPIDLGGTAVTGAVTATGSVFANAFVTNSDRNMKENFQSIDTREVLEKVIALPVSRWNFKGESDNDHIGPMAQDFRAAFGTGSDDKRIATVDADGVALAAIHGLNEKLSSELERKEAELAELRQTVRTENAALKAENADMAQRLAALEAMLREMQSTTSDTGGIQ